MDNTKNPFRVDHGGDDVDGDDEFRYLIVRPEKGGVKDLFRYSVLKKTENGVRFLEGSDEVVVGRVAADHRWVILVSIIARKIIGFFGKPMEWTGYIVDFILNLLSLNGGIFGLISSLLHGKTVVPHRGTETFISTIGHLDGRIDLYKGRDLADNIVASLSEGTSTKAELGNRGLMDLCMMAAKLAYENAQVVRYIVVDHWKMHFVDFYNCWNDFQKQMSTQVFILTDKPKDANLILISFRGTEPFDADDWSTDFDYSWYEIPKLGKVHMGFLEALGLGSRTNAVTFYNELIEMISMNIPANSVDVSKGPSEGILSSDVKQGRDDLYSTYDMATPSNQIVPPDMVKKSAYYTVRRKLRSLLEEHKNAKFIVTGHSLGGALAILFPSVLVLHEEMEMMRRLLCVYTFGQPRVGNRQLGRYMEAHLNNPVPKYFRVVYCNDLVPRLPYDDKTFLYKHFGVCLYYDSKYNEEIMKEEPNRNYFGLTYLIPEYLNAVWELIRGLTMGYIYGPEYREGWFSILLKIIGLVVPGLSAHSPTNYVDSVRLGTERVVQMSSL